MMSKPFGAGFPQTPPSAVMGVRSPDPVQRSQSLKVISRSYWKPIYKYVRLRWRKLPAEAEEITQEFFARALERTTFQTYDPHQARFRTFVRMCVDRLVVDMDRRHHAQKRGGEVSLLRLDFGLAEEEIEREAPVADPEAVFDAEWVKALVDAAVESLRAVCEREGRNVHFRAFELFHLRDDADRSTYETIASTLGISITDVNNRLSYARREFRVALLEALRDCTGSEQEMQDEARIVLGLSL